MSYSTYLLSETKKFDPVDISFGIISSSSGVNFQNYITLQKTFLLYHIAASNSIQTQIKLPYQAISLFKFSVVSWTNNKILLANVGLLANFCTTHLNQFNIKIIPVEEICN